MSVWGVLNEWRLQHRDKSTPQRIVQHNPRWNLFLSIQLVTAFFHDLMYILPISKQCLSPSVSCCSRSLISCVSFAMRLSMSSRRPSNSCCFLLMMPSSWLLLVNWAFTWAWEIKISRQRVYTQTMGFSTCIHYILVGSGHMLRVHALTQNIVGNN